MRFTSVPSSWGCLLVLVTLSVGGACRSPASSSASSAGAERDGRTRLTSHGAGPFEIGKPIPGRYLVESPEVKLDYEHEVYADAQPLDGFRMPNRSILAVLKEGPFASWFEDPDRTGGMDEKPPHEQLRERALESARDGVPVQFVVVDDTGPATESGVSVGRTLSELEERHPHVDLSARPPTFGDDRCLARTSDLPGVFLFFRTCKAARSGAPITRIDLVGPDGRYSL